MKLKCDCPGSYVTCRYTKWFQRKQLPIMPFDDSRDYITNLSMLQISSVGYSTRFAHQLTVPRANASISLFSLEFILASNSNEQHSHTEVDIFMSTAPLLLLMFWLIIAFASKACNNPAITETRWCPPVCCLHCSVIACNCLECLSACILLQLFVHVLLMSYCLVQEIRSSWFAVAFMVLSWDVTDHSYIHFSLCILE